MANNRYLLSKNTHTDLIKVITDLGYDPSLVEGGICAGYNQALAQFILASKTHRERQNKINAFFNLIKFICAGTFQKTRPSYYQKIEAMKQQRTHQEVIDMTDSITSLDKMIAETSTDIKNMASLETHKKIRAELSLQRKKRREEWANAIFTPEEKMVCEAEALIETMIIYLCPNQFNWLFLPQTHMLEGEKIAGVLGTPQPSAIHQLDIEPISKVVGSKNLDEAGGIAVFYTWPIVGNVMSLTSYFTSLENQIKKLAPLLQENIFFSISGGGHRIGCIYDTTISRWFLFDINTPPSILCSSPQLSAEIIEAIEYTGDLTTFNIIGLTIGENLPTLKSYFNDYQVSHSRRYQELAHTVNSHGCSIAHTAAIMGHEEVLKTTLACMSILFTANDNGDTPEDLAAQYNHTTIVELLKKQSAIQRLAQYESLKLHAKKTGKLDEFSAYEQLVIAIKSLTVKGAKHSSRNHAILKLQEYAKKAFRESLKEHTLDKYQDLKKYGEAFAHLDSNYSLISSVRQTTPTSEINHLHIKIKQAFLHCSPQADYTALSLEIETILGNTLPQKISPHALLSQSSVALFPKRKMDAPVEEQPISKRLRSTMTLKEG